MTKYIDIGIPEGLETKDLGDHREISRRWFSYRTLIITAFAGFWDLFLIFWYRQAFGGADMMAVLFPLLHVAVGIGLTYYVVASWCNRTSISFDREKIIVRHFPVPWRGNLQIDVRDIKQLYAKETKKQNEGSFYYTYQVRAITREGRNILFVGGLSTSEQAVYIEQSLEKYFGIEPQPVQGAIQ
jgi:hypothetical protein